MKKVGFLLVLLIFCGVKVFGQEDFRPGFIVTTDNDTIRGEVDYRSNLNNYESCRFKSGKGLQTYLPNQIKGYGFVDDKYYTSGLIEGKFAEVLILGRLSLYRSLEDFILRKGQDTLILNSERVDVEISPSYTAVQEKGNWKGIVSYMISDCDVSANFERLTFEEKSLAQLVMAYNECYENSFREVKEPVPWIRADYGITAGLTYSVLSTEYTSNQFIYLDDSYSTFSPSFGVMIGFVSPRVNDRVSFLVEVNYLKEEFTSLVVREGTPTRYFDTNISVTSISIPFSIRYTFPENAIGFFAQAGANYDIYFKSESSVLGEVVVGSVVETIEEREAVRFQDSSAGIWLGAGIYKSFDHFKGSLSLRFTHMANVGETKDLFQSRDLSININRISLNLLISRK